jgi:hypothetical protein
LMVFAPLGRSGGGRGRSAGGRSVQRRAGGWGRGRRLWVLLLSAAAGFFGGRRLWTGLLLLLLCGLMEGNRRAWERGALGWRRRWGDGCQGEEDGMRCGCGCCVLCDVRLWAAAWKKQNQNRGKGRRRCGYGVEGEAAVFGLRELSSWLAGRKEIWWKGKGRQLQEKGEKEGGAAPPLKRAAFRVRSFFCTFF